MKKKTVSSKTFGPVIEPKIHLAGSHPAVARLGHTNTATPGTSDPSSLTALSLPLHVVPRCCPCIQLAPQGVETHKPGFKATLSPPKVAGVRIESDGFFFGS